MERYFDHSATTKVKPQVIQAMVHAMEQEYGNPSSLHRLGHGAERMLKAARAQIAGCLGVDAGEVYFTSGGTESNNIALLGSCLAMRKPGHIITSKIEHKSVLECTNYLSQKGFPVSYLDVDTQGVVDLAQLEQLLCDDTCLISIMHVNNEVGSIQPLEEIAHLIRNRAPNAILHVDGVQSFCKLPIPKGVAHCITVSGHKIGGPKGVGAVYLKKGVKVAPLLWGGGQEKGVRSGTENVPGIVGFAKATQLIDPIGDLRHVTTLKHTFEAQVLAQVPGVCINSPQGGSPYICNLSVPGIRSEILLHSLEQHQVYVSSGSACASNRPQPSHVLIAMGLDAKRVDSSLRFSFGADNTLEDVEAGAAALAQVVKANEFLRK